MGVKIILLILSTLLIWLSIIECTESVEGGLYVSHKLTSMPRVGFGTAGMGWTTTTSVCAALEAGFRLIDTAQAHEWYSEEDLGVALAECWAGWGEQPLDDLVIVTKVHPRNYGEDELKDSLEASRMKLFGGMPNERDKWHVIDAVLLHAPYCWPGHCTTEQEAQSWQDAWTYLESAERTRSVQAIGVSNFDVRLLTELLMIANTKPTLVQNWMDPFHQDKEVRKLCDEHGIVYMAYSSFGTQWGSKHKTNPVFDSDVLKAIASDHGRSVTDVVLSWAVQLGVVVLPRSTRDEHIRANAAILPDPKVQQGVYATFLTPSDMAQIDALDGSIGSPW